MRPDHIRLLAGRAQRYESQGDPGEGALSWEDVAAALGKVETTAALLGRVVHADQTQYVEQLRRDLVQELVGDPRVQRWKLPKEPLLEPENSDDPTGWLTDLSTLAIVEAILEHRLQADRQALAVQMPYWEWMRHWKPEYERVVVSLVDAWSDRLREGLR